MKLLMDWLIFIRKKGTRRHLFTNYVRFSKFEALELYEITPFSNCWNRSAVSMHALELYEITPFSNGAVALAGLGVCFGTIRNYTILKQNQSSPLLSRVFDIYDTSFSDVLHSTQELPTVLDIYEFTSFSNRICMTGMPLQFWISTNLHHSQTEVNMRQIDKPFWISTNLHHSQTDCLIVLRLYVFWISTNLHHSQTDNATTSSLL